MYRDNSLIPKEAVRMAALGALVGQDRVYSDVASDVRQFAARIVGPSLDLLGTSIEVLKLEGLIETAKPAGRSGDEVLRLTDSGRAALLEYLSSTVRPGVSDLNKLVIALKLRFIDILGPEQRRDQLENLRSMYEGERARLQDLVTYDNWSAGLMPDWLTFELGLLDQRITWCGKQLDRH
ncbi:MAG: hypothetical protein CMM47_00880 [Rhodospirillaceae bacterium]|nr:hypothetical protein [Rhodospirillaceae bacterium]